MVKRKRAAANRGFSPAEILYFLEDGRVTPTPWDQPQNDVAEEEIEPQDPTFSFDDPTPVPGQQMTGAQAETQPISLEDDGEEDPAGNRREKTLICDEEDLPWLDNDPEPREERVCAEDAASFHLDMLELPEETDIESDDIEELDEDAVPGERTLVEDVEDEDFSEVDDDEFQRAAKARKPVSSRSFSDDTPTLKPRPAEELAKEFDLESDEFDLNKFQSDKTAQPSKAAAERQPKGREDIGQFSAQRQPLTLSGALRSPAQMRAFSRGKSLSLRMTNSGPQKKDAAGTPPPVERQSDISGKSPQPSAIRNSVDSVVPESKKNSRGPAPATGAKDVDDASICLLSSAQALNHFSAKLKPMTAASIGSLARRAQWATAALFGQQLFVSGRPIPAQKVFEHLVDEKPSEAFPYAMLGALHLSLGNDEEAERRFDEALEIDQTDLCALLGRAEVCLRSARPTDALVDVKLAISQAKLDESPLLSKAEAMLAVTQKMIRFLS